MSKKVKIYGLPTCPFCKKAQKYFKDKGIDFKYLDVSTDPKLADEMIRKSGQKSVPVIEVNGEIIVGFDKTKIDALL